MSLRFQRIVPAALAWVLLVAAPGRGQVARGTVTEDGTGQPVVGAFIVLVDAAGRDRVAALTDQHGRYALSAPAPGRYRLRVDRIGYRATLSPEVELTLAQALDQDLRVRVDAIRLAAISLATERVCDTPPAEAGRISEVWEEARKALAATAWTEARERYRLTVRQFERRRDGGSDKVGDEGSAVWVGINSSSPFVSLPPQELAESGYARVEADATRYFAPDAAVLLSNDFAESHCFRLRPPDAEHPGMIGLAFEPEKERDLVDVEGALWINGRSAELKLLEYAYTGISDEVNENQAGGYVEFEQLPSGAWIVSDWQVNAPAIRRAPETRWERVPGGFVSTRTARMQDTVVAVLESGGSVEQIHSLDGALLRGSETAAVSGAVADSLRNVPLAGATVSLRNTVYRTVTDSLGAFRFGDIPGGRYAAVVYHPRLDSLDLAPLARDVEVAAGSSERVELAIPSLTTLLAATCEEQDGAAAVVGEVREAASGAPLPARIQLAWRDDEGVPRQRDLVAEGSGTYVACGVPTGRTIVARAEFPGRSVREVLAVPASRRTMRLDFALAAAELESVIAVEARGQGPVAIVGWVVDDATGEPLAGAQVALGESGAGAVTDRDGRFLVGAVAPGAHVVEVQFLGYATARAGLEVPEDEWLSLAVRLVPEPLAGEPLEAEVGLATDRREAHTVYRLTSEEIGRYPVMGLVELLAVTVPGVEVGFDETFGCYVPVLRPTGGFAKKTGPLNIARSVSPLVVLEGTPLSNPCELETMNPSDVEQIEVVSATAGANRYGWRGMNGVIRVEIKSHVRRRGEAQEETPEREEPEREPPAVRRVQ